MHASDLIASALTEAQKEPLPETAQQGICCVTGNLTDTIARKHLLGYTFLDLNLLAAHDSPRIGVNVWYAFKFGDYGIDKETGELKKRKKTPECMACWWCDGQSFIEMTKPKIRDMVLRGTTAKNWAAWVTTSYKKHGSLRSKVNNQPFGFWGFDDLQVDASDRAKVLIIWKKLRTAQAKGIGRSYMETLDIPVNVMQKLGLILCNDFVLWAHDYYQSPLYQFLLYLLPSQDELKGGYDDRDLPAAN